MSQNPSMPWQEVKDRVLSTVTPLTSLRGLTVTGGLLNAAGALGDCNINGVLDDLDISGGTSTDCNSNAVPDECEINEDCQPNGVQDICDIADGTSQDCNGNDYPDECELDGCGTPLTSQCGSGDCCTSNGTRGCDCTLCLHTIAKTFQGCYYSSTWSGLCAYMASMYPVCDCDPAVTTPRNDCNDNGVIDECDIAAGTSQDVIGVYEPPDTPGPDGVPDECQTDCNNNNFPDLYDVYNENISLDCNDNLVPDECETDNDCNCNGIPDDCDIASGTSSDTNENGIPDECDPNMGACCLSGVPCDMETSCSCAARGGTFLGASNCILQPRGACCLGTTCQPQMKQCDCINQGGLFVGAGTTCTPMQCQQFGPQGP